MKRIGALSDTHGIFDDKLKDFFKDVDELWHAGDIGSASIADEMASFKPLIAVYGNIDDASVRATYRETANFECENLSAAILHIAGRPGKYSPKAMNVLKTTAPDILLCGHSHILKVMYDEKFKVLYLNPGAAGFYGFHKVRTAVRFAISGDKITDMEVGEWRR